MTLANVGVGTLFAIDGRFTYESRQDSLNPHNLRVDRGSRSALPGVWVRERCSKRASSCRCLMPRMKAARHASKNEGLDRRLPNPIAERVKSEGHDPNARPRESRRIEE